MFNIFFTSVTIFIEAFSITKERLPHSHATFVGFDTLKHDLKTITSAQVAIFAFQSNEDGVIMPGPNTGYEPLPWSDFWDLILQFRSNNSNLSTAIFMVWL